MQTLLRSPSLKGLTWKGRLLETRNTSETGQDSHAYFCFTTPFIFQCAPICPKLKKKRLFSLKFGTWFTKTSLTVHCPFGGRRSFKKCFHYQSLHIKSVRIVTERTFDDPSSDSHVVVHRLSFLLKDTLRLHLIVMRRANLIRSPPRHEHMKGSAHTLHVVPMQTWCAITTPCVYVCVCVSRFAKRRGFTERDWIPFPRPEPDPEGTVWKLN